MYQISNWEHAKYYITWFETLEHVYLNIVRAGEYSSQSHILSMDLLINAKREQEALLLIISTLISNENS